MPAPDASTPARDAIDAFIQHLADRGLSATTRRIRKTYLSEYLRHAQQAAADSAGDATDGGHAGAPLTAGDLMDGGRAAAWLADAAAGKTRTRNTSRGPEAAAYPNSMRVRIDSVNALAEFIGDPWRLDRQPPARGFALTPGDTEALLHDLTVKRPIHANAMTALRTAAVAALVADTGRGVPELADLNVSALHLDGADPYAEVEGEQVPLTQLDGAHPDPLARRPRLDHRRARGQRPRPPVDPDQARPGPRRRPVGQARHQPGRRPHPARLAPHPGQPAARHPAAPRRAARRGRRGSLTCQLGRVARAGRVAAAPAHGWPGVTGGGRTGSPAAEQVPAVAGDVEEHGDPPVRLGRGAR